ncbi:MAG: nitronate monooxygenase [Chrysiogenetes bacterium]|nr:nitronate monooxygenase [Chrysiogenetes bacterium]
MNQPRIIQGGMGIGVSDWRLARAVALSGQMGVVSGTALTHVLVRRLQDGDSGGHMRRALASFPVQEISERVLARYYIPGGKAQDAPYKNPPMFTLKPARELEELTVLANFAEVFLAKEGHEGLVGINYLEKVQLPTLASLFGALLAGVDYVLVGAGIPRQIPGVIDALIRGEDVSLKVHVDGAARGEEHEIHFSARRLLGDQVSALSRPKFLAIISSATLAKSLARATPPPDGFVVEAPEAGGHNAPPRGALELSELGEPVYGERDAIDLEAIAALGLPFWLAGSVASPKGLADALAAGACGIQVGTAFAFCHESGFTPKLKQRAVAFARKPDTRVRTDAKASPTGFPFKLMDLEGTLARQELYAARRRPACDVGLLRAPYRALDGSVGYRCPAEDEAAYVKKGGEPDACEGRMCLCNGLLASIGQPQVRSEGCVEPAIVTSGNDLSCVRALTSDAGHDYSAADVVAYLLG